MKKLFIAALFATTIFTSAFAAEKNVSNKALRNFQSEFRDAENVQWTAKETFSKAVFTVDGESKEAFFDLEGTLIGTSRTINIDKLPTEAKRLFANRYADYTVKEAIRFNDTENICYYISAENETESVILKISEGRMSIFKRVGK